MKLLKGGLKGRQISALERLEKQLTVGTKWSKNTSTKNDDSTPFRNLFELSDKDITRIKREIQTLKSKV